MGIFGGFKKKQKEELNDTEYVNTIIKHSKDEPLGVSGENVLYAGYNELGGYYYFQTYIIGRFKIKTKTGAKLSLEDRDYTLNLKSDMDEFESEQADIFEGHVTRIDFEIEKAAAEKIKRSTIKRLVLTTKNKEVVFMPYKKA